MTLTVWHRFLTRQDEGRCEAYLRRHLGYRGGTSLVEVCLRHMQATERPACSLEVVAGRIRVGNPPSWTAALPADASTSGTTRPIRLRARMRRNPTSASRATTRRIS